MPDIIGYGMAGMDLCLVLDHLPAPNEAMFVREMSWQYGGTVTTGLCAARILSGASCAMVTNVSGAVGKLVKADLARHGIDVSHVEEYTEPGKESRLTVVLTSLADGGSRSPCGLPFSKSPPHCPEEVDTDFLATAKYIFVHRAEGGQLRAAAWAHEHGIGVLMDADIWTPRIGEILPYVDYFIASEKCFARLAQELPGTVEEKLRAVRESLPPHALAMVTMGEKGSFAVDDEGYFHTDSFPVAVVDTAGCGDVFHGAYLACLMRGMTNREAARYCSAVSAIKATRLGCRAGIPTDEVVREFMETGSIDYSRGIDERCTYYAAMPALSE